MHTFRFYGIWVAAVFLLGFASWGCSTKMKILASQSNVSNAEAAAELETQLNSEANEDCETLTISSGVGAARASGVGIGFVIPEDCKECEELKGQQQKVVEKEERIFVVNALLECSE